MRDMRVIMDTDKTGENLKQLRKNAGLRVQDVRESLGMESVQSVYDWEGHRKLPRIENILALSRLYGVAVETLLAYDPLDENSVSEKEEIHMEDEKMKQQYEEIEQSEDAERILCRLAEFEENFEDMLFGSGSVTEEGAQVEVKLDEVYWSTERMSLPESLEYFSLRSYHYQLHPEMNEKEKNKVIFRPETKEVVLTEKALKDDVFVLHLLLHMHEAVYENLPGYYRDTLYHFLYKDLESKIPDLKRRMDGYAKIAACGPTKNCQKKHSAVFYLKGLDLDLRMGYPLETVYQY